MGVGQGLIKHGLTNPRGSVVANGTLEMGKLLAVFSHRPMTRRLRLLVELKAGFAEKLADKDLALSQGALAGRQWHPHRS
jgi:hypothetical protein